MSTDLAILCKTRTANMPVNTPFISWCLVKVEELSLKYMHGIDWYLFDKCDLVFLIFGHQYW